MSIKSLLSKIQKNYDGNVRVLKGLRKEQVALTKAGVDYGTPNYRNQRYLRIVKPAVGDQPRQFDYIGSDKTKQEAALSALARGKEFEKISEQINQLEKDQVRIADALRVLIDEHGWSQKAARRRAFL